MKFKVGAPISHVPSGHYEAIVEDITRRTTFKRACLEFKYRIATGDHKGVLLLGFCNADYETFSSRTKLLEWYGIATGDENLEAGTEIDTDDFFGKIFEVKVEERTSQKTKQVFSNVISIIRLVGTV